MLYLRRLMRTIECLQRITESRCCHASVIAMSTPMVILFMFGLSRLDVAVVPSETGGSCETHYRIDDDASE